MAYALLSVSDKDKIVELAEGLVKQGYSILASGGTSRVLQNEGIQVTAVEELTGFPEILGGRVKTLHPKIHGALLYKRDQSEHLEEIQRHQIPSIDVVAVNLYPFQKAIESKPDDLQNALENIDIGGPTLIRAAAKNFKDVIVLTNPEQYEGFLEKLSGGSVTLSRRKDYARQAFSHVSQYDSKISEYLSQDENESTALNLRFPDSLIPMKKYGENWHQKAFFAKMPNGNKGLFDARQLHGGDLGYNNYLDLDAALTTLNELDSSRPSVVVVKHGNPCGVASCNSLVSALERAWQGDPVSAFGSVIAVNQEITVDFLKVLCLREGPDGRKGWFVEVIIAPSFHPEALEYIQSKKSKANLRLLSLDSIGQNSCEIQIRSVTGGLVAQDLDQQHTHCDENLFLEAREIHSRSVGVVCGEVTEQEHSSYNFSWTACKHIKSNAIAISRSLEGGEVQLIGMGAGQPNRKDSARIAVDKASENLALEWLYYNSQAQSSEVSFLKKSHCEIQEKRALSKEMAQYVVDEFNQRCFASSDAFFPFPDGIEQLAHAGLKKIIQPGGSIKDSAVIDRAQELGLTMIFTGMRHFKH